MHADKLEHAIKKRISEVVGMHPDKMSPEIRSHFIQSGGLAMIAKEGRPTVSRQRMRERLPGEMPDSLSSEDEQDWIIVNGKFADVYMSALAALLAKELELSPLTNEEPSSGVNLQCLIEDVASSSPTAATGALISVVMKGLRVDPETPIKRLLAFRRSRANQLAELSGIFDDLKREIEKSSSPRKLEETATKIYENKISPGLDKLKRDLAGETIQSVWEGVQRAMTVSAPAGGMLAATTGFSGSMLLGAGAFITLTDVGIKSYLARAKARSSSPYTYLFDIEKKFSLPHQWD